ncbi:hypothetical protein PoB_004678600 [Plakobranchus ocellatus]|uniref:Uncharacterized protein n=1 Tax=Plakobranchus ocellatus TaxID=259542 RepID=A0AAV4BMP1_9GAST|nr:hypothetical protein PoB_004678600 [Plakobranchus ocellatus]
MPYATNIRTLLLVHRCWDKYGIHFALLMLQRSDIQQECLCEEGQDLGFSWLTSIARSFDFFSSPPALLPRVKKPGNLLWFRVDTGELIELGTPLKIELVTSLIAFKYPNDCTTTPS